MPRIVKPLLAVAHDWHVIWLRLMKELRPARPAPCGKPACPGAARTWHRTAATGCAAIPAEGPRRAGRLRHSLRVNRVRVARRATYRKPLHFQHRRHGAPQRNELRRPQAERFPARGTLPPTTWAAQSTPVRSRGLGVCGEPACVREAARRQMST